MTLQEIINSISKILSIKEDDTKENKVMLDAINDGYIILCYIDKRVARAYTPVINGFLTLPSNCIKVIKSTPEIDVSDTVVGNSIITNKTGVVEMLYTYIREPLLELGDEPDLNLKLQYSLIDYACYKILQSRGENGNDYLNQFYNIKDEFENKDDSGASVVETVRIVE